MPLHSVAAVAFLMAWCTEPPLAYTDENVVAFLADVAQPISVTDGSWIDPYVADQRVVLIGEEVHGIAEHIHLKAELARRLITHHGFTHIFIEDDVFKARFIHDNIRADTPQSSATLFRFFFWCWNVVELHEFFDQAADLRPIPVVLGIDVQSHNFAVYFLTPLAETDEQLAAIGAIEEIFAGGRSEYAIQTSEQKAENLALIGTLTDVFAPADVEPIQRHLRCVLAVWSVANDLDLRMNARDRGMAESAMDVLGSDPDAKAVIFAHNAHAGYTPFYENHSEAGIMPLGKRLRDTHAMKTLSIGAVFATGSTMLDPRAREENGGPTRIHASPPPGSQADHWISIPHKRWLLDVNALNNLDLPDPVAAFFDASPAGYFDNYGPARPLGGSYDLIVGYREVSPAAPPK